MNRRDLLRGAAAAALFGSLASAGDRGMFNDSDDDRFGLSPPTPRTILGVHTRLTDEVEFWKISRTLEMVREMGAGWIVELFPWAYIEPRRSDFDWAHPDHVVREATRQGLSVIARLDFVPQWARPDGSNPRMLSGAHWLDYANFVAQFARRYRKAIRHFIIWNEPNTSFEWGYSAASPQAYVDLLATTSSALRGVHSNPIVLGAGLAPTLERSELAVDDTDFLQMLYDDGLPVYTDGLAAHTYGWKFAPDDPPREDRLNFARVEILRQIMVKNGDKSKSIYITETGWNDSPRWTKAVRPAQRIQYTLRALQMATTDWPWVRAMCLWTFRLPAPSHDYNDYFTLVDTNFRPKPIYNQIRAHSGEYTR
jgi:hypothetical protein